MKAVKSALAVITAILISFSFAGDAESQSREDAINSFNEGFSLFNEQGDLLAAIDKFKETIEIAEQVGPEANNIRERAEGQIPRLAFMHAAQLVRERQLEEAIGAFENAIELAGEFNDDQIASRARGNLPALYLNLGNQHFRNEENERALEKYNQAIELNPSYVSAYYQRGLVFRRMGQLENAIENFDISIELADEAGDQENVERGQRAVRDYLVYRASEQIENENFNRALDLLNRAAGYGESASLHYRFAETYNFLERHNDALSSAQRALELEDGSRADMARIYFEVGVAQKGLENESAACEAFRNALFGEFQAPAEHQIEHELNCN
ncbi:tetratricopeptide repeat protein [Balneolales bacterium ANBcel1]|nr:tetratricopeptide repeat protein [Balneolales bacterium ANBcel1]